MSREELSWKSSAVQWMMTFVDSRGLSLATVCLPAKPVQQNQAQTGSTTVE